MKAVFAVWVSDVVFLRGRPRFQVLVLRANAGKNAWGQTQMRWSPGADLRGFCPSLMLQMDVKTAPRHGSLSAAAGFVRRQPGLRPLLDARITARPFCSGFNGDHSSPFLLDFNLSCSAGCLFLDLELK